MERPTAAGQRNTLCNRTTFQVQLYGLPEEDAPAKMRQSTDKAWKEITAAQMDTPAPQQ